MPVIIVLSEDDTPPEPPPSPLDLTEVVSLRVTGFLDLTQVLRLEVPAPLILTHTVALQVPGQGETPGGGAYDLTLSPPNVQSASFSASTTADTQLDVTVLGTGGAGSVGASLGPWSATYGGLPDSGEGGGRRDQFGTVTTTHYRIKPPSEPRLPELIPWAGEKKTGSSGGDSDSSGGIVAGGVSSGPASIYWPPADISRTPSEHRALLRTDPRFMDVDAVVLAALSTVPARVMLAPPFPGYRLTPDNWTEGTKGKTASEVVGMFWGLVGVTTQWRDGVLEVRGPDLPGGDLVLGAPFEEESWEIVVLDNPSGVEVEGDDTPTTDKPDRDNPKDPSDPRNSPDPHERDRPYPPAPPDPDNPQPSQAPSPTVIDARANGVSLGWPRAVDASQYVLERADGARPPASGLGVWSTVYLGGDLRIVDQTVVPEATYSYRLTVNGLRGYTLPSDPVSVTVPEADHDGEPYPPENLQTIQVTDTTAQLTWDQPRPDPDDAPHPRHGMPSRWTVAWVNQQDENDAGTLEVNDLAAELQGLRLGSTYDVTVVAVNQAGDSEPATLVLETQGGPPPEVTDLTVGTPGPGSVPLTFTAVQGATNYEIQVALVPDGVSTLKAADLAGLGIRFQWTLNATVTLPKWFEGGQIEAFARGFTPATRYVLRVRGNGSATLPDPHGPWSEAVEVTTSLPVPGAPPDAALIDFERDGSVTLTLSHPNDDGSYVTTRINKLGGRLNWERETVTAMYWEVAERDDQDALTGEWQLATTQPRTSGFQGPFRYTASARETRYAYDIPGWPETLTGSMAQTTTWRLQKGKGQHAHYDPVKAGSEQQKTHQEWSPQGWLNREISRSTVMSGFIDVNLTPGAEEPQYRRDPVHTLKTTVKTHAPLGYGLWYHDTSVTQDQDMPVYDAQGEVVELTRATTTTRPPPTIDDQAPPQTTLPSYARKRRNGRFVQPPPMQRNIDEGSLSAYKLGEDWFVTPEDGPEAPGANSVGGGDEKDGPTTGGSGDSSGNAGPEKGRPEKPATPRKKTVPGSGKGPVVKTKIPWVRDPQALDFYARMLASAYGPRKRITRSYFAPVNPAVGGAVKEVRADISDGSIRVSVTTEVKL